MPNLKVVIRQNEMDIVSEGRAEQRPEELRLLEAMLFASATPLDEKELAARLPQGIDVRAALVLLQEEYATRGVNLVRIGGKWTFRTASDLYWLLSNVCSIVQQAVTLRIVHGAERRGKGERRRR